MLFIEASAKTRDGVQTAFEELVEKAIQTPGLWEEPKDKQNIQMIGSSPGVMSSCGC